MTHYLAGPMALHHCCNPHYDLNIYLFGDVHELSAHCGKSSTSIDNFIDLVIRHHPNLHIDIFLESSVLIDGFIDKTPNLDKKLSYIQNVVRKLENCIYPISNTFNNNHHCKYSNIRIHPIDFRPQNDIPIWHYFVSCYKNKDIGESSFDIINETQSVHNHLLEFMYDNGISSSINPVKLLVKFYDIDNIMESQYETINSKIKRRIDRYLDKMISKLIPGGTISLLKGLKKFAKHYSDPNIPLDTLAKFLVPYIEAETWIIDYYTWARLFGSKYDASYIDGTFDYPKNVIYYAGNYHTESTLNLLKYLKFAKI
jgi:hypothetical protein